MYEDGKKLQNPMTLDCKTADVIPTNEDTANTIQNDCNSVNSATNNGTIPITTDDETKDVTIRNVNEYFSAYKIIKTKKRTCVIVDAGTI
mmetsp:Transcript_46292/g.41399  ORF Transcript_46292/g.41399 Transcript_46292/m.41399 type:complete len:90 (-) Transcript_46292:31-300(-)